MNVSDMNLRVLQIMSMALSGWARQIVRRTCRRWRGNAA